MTKQQRRGTFSGAPGNCSKTTGGRIPGQRSAGSCTPQLGIRRCLGEVLRVLGAEELKAGEGGDIDAGGSPGSGSGSESGWGGSGVRFNLQNMT